MNTHTCHRTTENFTRATALSNILTQHPLHTCKPEHVIECSTHMHLLPCVQLHYSHSHMYIKHDWVHVHNSPLSTLSIISRSPSIGKIAPYSRFCPWTEHSSTRHTALVRTATLACRPISPRPFHSCHDSCHDSCQFKPCIRFVSVHKVFICMSLLVICIYVLGTNFQNFSQ